jgi:hypothetical protein
VKHLREEGGLAAEGALDAVLEGVRDVELVSVVEVGFRGKLYFLLGVK